MWSISSECVKIVTLHALVLVSESYTGNYMHDMCAIVFECKFRICKQRMPPRQKLKADEQPNIQKGQC